LTSSVCSAPVRILTRCSCVIGRDYGCARWHRRRLCVA
jgi:hypothetical protein